MRLVPLWLLVFTTSAVAAPAAQVLEGVAADDDALVVGYAQAVAGGEGKAGTGAGLMVTLDGPLDCKVVEAGVHGALRPSQISGRADYAVCLSRLGLTVVFEGTRGHDLVPGLDARRSLWARHYDNAYDRATFALGEYDGHTVLEMVFGHGETKQLERKVVALDFDMTLYRHRGEELTVDAIAFTSNAVKAGDDNQGGVTAAFYPARLRFERDGQYVQAEAGWGLAGGSVTQSSETKVNGETTSMWSETIDGTGLPQMAIFAGTAEVGVERERMSASTRLSRGFYPTFDGNLAREARLSAELSYRRRRTELALSPFAARTHTWTREDGDSRDVSAGATLHVGRVLSPMFRVDAVGEAGYSPYARLDRLRTPCGSAARSGEAGPCERERLPHSSLGGQVLVALTATKASASRANLLRALAEPHH